MRCVRAKMLSVEWEAEVERVLRLRFRRVGGRSGGGVRRAPEVWKGGGVGEEEEEEEEEGGGQASKKLLRRLLRSSLEACPLAPFGQEEKEEEEEGEEEVAEEALRKLLRSLRDTRPFAPYGQLLGAQRRAWLALSMVDVGICMNLESKEKLRRNYDEA